jgi:hypothetical protein
MRLEPPIKIGKSLTVYSVQGLVSYLNYYYKAYQQLLLEVDIIIARKLKRELHIVNTKKNFIRDCLKELDERNRTKYWKTKYIKLVEHNKRKLKDTREVPTPHEIREAWEESPIIVKGTEEQLVVYKDRYKLIYEDGLELHSLSGQLLDWVKLDTTPNT